MDYKQKYLKYKNKYLALHQIGGAVGAGSTSVGTGSTSGGRAFTTLPRDVMNTIFESLAPKEIIKACESNKSLCQAVSWSKLIRDRKININSVLDLDEPAPTMCGYITDPTERASCRIFYNYTKYPAPILLNNFMTYINNGSLRDYLDTNGSRLETVTKCKNFWYKTTIGMLGRVQFRITLFGSLDENKWVQLAQYIYYE